VKTPDQFTADAVRRLDRDWHLAAAGQPAGWPHTVTLGRPGRDDITAGFTTVQAWAIDWRTWATDHCITLTWANRDVHGTRQSLPTHATIDTPDQAATLAAGPWPARLARARSRAATLTTRFPDTWTPTLLRAVDPLTPTDFDLLLTAADWFAHHNATGLTARQVPIEGLHGKWLNRHRRHILTLTGKDDLGLVERPPRVFFTYLDPTHLATGGRRYDSATAGDPTDPAYPPEIIVITENKDTALFFPSVPRGIAVEGSGKAAPLLATILPWLTIAPHILYWGDMDSAGYEILDQLRKSGIPATSILMDMPAYLAHQQYGATTDDAGKPLPCDTRRPLPHLTPAERQVYDLLTDPNHDGPRRVEQERIPLDTAKQHMNNALRAARSKTATQTLTTGP
jgi:hypothetical protein